jgi:hypothetical protein
MARARAPGPPPDDGDGLHAGEAQGLVEGEDAVEGGTDLKAIFEILLDAWIILCNPSGPDAKYQRGPRIGPGFRATPGQFARQCENGASGWILITFGTCGRWLLGNRIHGLGVFGRSRRSCCPL